MKVNQWRPRNLSWTRVVLSALLLALAFWSAARLVQAAQIDPGFDLFETQPGSSMTIPVGLLPADFFGSGSDPFTGDVALEGVPIGTFNGVNVGATDTVVHRQTGGDPEQGIVFPPIEIVALSLQSVAPITVTFGGGSPELWDVSVGLSPTEPSTGLMVIERNPDEFDMFPDLFSLLKFTRQGSPGEVQIDTGQPNLGAVLVDVIREPWSETPPPGTPHTNSPFYPTEPVEATAGGGPLGWNVLYESLGNLGESAAPTTGTIIIKKQTNPDLPDSANLLFEFDPNVMTALIPGIPGTFQLMNGGEQTFSDLPPGLYGVRETEEVFIRLNSIECNDPTANSEQRIDDKSEFAFIDLAVGEVVT